MSALKYWFLVTLIVHSIASPLQDNLVAATPEEYELVPGISPTHYQVKLTLAAAAFENQEESNFPGQVIITFTSEEAGNLIKLHGNRLTIQPGEVELKTTGVTPVVVPLASDTFISDPETDIITIETTDPLTAAGEYTLTISYTGVLRADEMYGFYKSSYKDSTEAAKVLVTTQFQPSYARRAFPCFDEPSLKAKFDITLEHPTAYTAVGNTPLVSNDDVDGITTTVFKTTPTMPTYLIAFIVSDFTFDEGSPIAAGIPYKVYSREEAKATRSRAVEVGPKLLNALEEWTGVQYSVSGIGKMDQVAIPDFAAGAMENWGLVTYRETALLWDELESSNRYNQRVTTVIAHEFAHMWFGDLVTTHSWSDTFLNEGFATYFEYHITKEVEPDWELEKQFVIEQIHEVFDLDSRKTTHALSHPVLTLEEINSRFNAISYNKGGAIFRMVESFMGTDSFKTGITAYLTDPNHQFGNVAPTDLWESLQPHTANLPATKTLGEIMENWVVLPGFPLLTVKSAAANAVTISQNRFLMSVDVDETKWYVPISYTKSNAPTEFNNVAPKEWLLPDADLTIANALTDADWFIINNQQTGYYRVNYDDILWNRIAVALRKEDFNGIVDLNRAQIVDDLFTLAKKGIHTYSRVFELVSFLAQDQSYYPWYAAFNAFGQMLERTGDDRVRVGLSSYVLHLMVRLIEVVPFTTIDDNDHTFTLKKVEALTWACKLKDNDCISHSIEEFNNYVITKKRPNKNLRSIVYCNGLRHSSKIKQDWDFLWSEFTATKISTEQVTILSALGCTTDATILKDYLTKSITVDSGIRKQDALSVFSAVYSGNPQGVDIALDFLIANYPAIAEYYKGLNSLSRMVSGVASKFTNQNQLNKLIAFAAIPELDIKLKAAADEAIESVRDNLAWTTRLDTELLAYFALIPDGANSLSLGTMSAVGVLLCYYLFY